MAWSDTTARRNALVSWAAMFWPMSSRGIYDPVRDQRFECIGTDERGMPRGDRDSRGLLHTIGALFVPTTNHFSKRTLFNSPFPPFYFSYSNRSIYFSIPEQASQKVVKCLHQFPRSEATRMPAAPTAASSPPKKRVRCTSSVSSFIPPTATPRSMPSRR